MCTSESHNPHYFLEGAIDTSGHQIYNRFKLPVLKLSICFSSFTLRDRRQQQQQAHVGFNVFIFDAAFQGSHKENPWLWKMHYRRHNTYVKDLIPAENLLVYEVTEVGRFGA